MLKTTSRTLLNNGISIISVEDAASLLLETGDMPSNIAVERCGDSETFKLIYGYDPSYPTRDDEIHPKHLFVKDNDIDQLMKKISHKRDIDVSDESHFSRIEQELKFFDSNKKVEFLCVLMKLIERFKHDGVIWGIGRGSSCASYILYLLEVHDINPIKFDIPFREFSKE